MIGKLLIANRGEIAIRVMRAAREMGVRSVAIFTEADTRSLHVDYADEAYSVATYLDPAEILAVASRCGADAIHPGYGFLSERAEFSEACEAAKIIFVGPSGVAMRRLGAKIESKQLAVQVGVPVTPGCFEPGAKADRLRAAALEIGYPIMLKASAGGGGRGMRVVRDPVHFDAEFRTASDEALKAFGDGEMMVEKLIERPRHVEAQILADHHGNVATLFERECSIQRRHQKLIEEAPAPCMSPSLWERMRTAAASLARAAEYVGAGTVEFIVDVAGENFYFMEVNARLQVEHPVTEAITGLDLVKWQIRIAQGDVLELDQGLMDGDRSLIRGHSIEARIVAEDPGRGFLPSSGEILAWAEPKLPGIRVDTGYGPGREVPQIYDSLLAKVIASGATRLEAIGRLREGLLDFHVLGVRTNIAYLLEILAHPKFQAGEFDTGFLERSFKDWQPGFPDAAVAGIAEAALVASAATSA